jgi:G:T-mismatch repair DNA endonuclease (very short patch repair protein)
MRRDRRYERRLRQEGISVWRFWEHELKKSVLDRTLRRLELAVNRSLRAGQLGPALQIR